jgi:hypothetical protein
MFMVVLASAFRASAQTAGYIGGAVFADVRQFGGTIGQTPFVDDSMTQDATGVGGSVRVGTWLHPRWSLEAGLDLSSKTTHSFKGPVIAIFPPVPAVELKSSTGYTSVTTLLGFHSPEGRRVRLGYRAGFSFVRETLETDFPDFRSSLAGVPRSTLAVPTTSLTSKRNAGALTLGFDAAIDVTPRLAVVPEVRASTFSIGAGPTVFLIRPGLSARWKF